MDNAIDGDRLIPWTRFGAALRHIVASRYVQQCLQIVILFRACARIDLRAASRRVIGRASARITGSLGGRCDSLMFGGTSKDPRQINENVQKAPISVSGLMRDRSVDLFVAIDEAANQIIRPDCFPPHRALFSRP